MEVRDNIATFWDVWQINPKQAKRNQLMSDKPRLKGNLATYRLDDRAKYQCILLLLAKTYGKRRRTWVKYLS